MKTNTQFTVTPVAEMVDIVIKGAYVYVSGKDQMAVQVRSVKADTNEILVQELDGKLNLIKDARFTVRLHELYSAGRIRNAQQWHCGEIRATQGICNTIS